MSTTWIIIIVLGYVAPMLISLVTGIVENWEDLHTIKDFIGPYDGFFENFMLVYFPVSNFVMAVIVIIDLVCKAVSGFLNIRIK